MCSSQSFSVKVMPKTLCAVLIYRCWCFQILDAYMVLITGKIHWRSKWLFSMNFWSCKRGLLLLNSDYIGSFNKGVKILINILGIFCLSLKVIASIDCLEVLKELGFSGHVTQCHLNAVVFLLFASCNELQCQFCLTLVR